MRSITVFWKLAGTGIFLALSSPAFASQIAITIVCKSDGLAPTDGSCAGKGGFVVNTGFDSGTYEICLDRAERTDKIPPHFTPWAPALGTAASTDAEAEEAKAAGRRTTYCRGLYPNLNSAGNATMAWTSTDYITRVSLSLGTEAECVTRLKAAEEIPLIEGVWKNDIEDFCKTKGTAPDSKPAGKFRSRWVQVGGGWSTPWVSGHEEAFCGHGANCSCGDQNLCGKIEAGKTTTAWPNGCEGAGWTIRCESEADDEAASGSSSGQPGMKFWLELKNAPEDANRQMCRMNKNYTGPSSICNDKAGTTCTQMRGNLLGGLFFDVMECKEIIFGK
ncbi:MAG: hypothetical protein EOP11_04040 [Proteobacteria bacterium]|nr:MAG: hypothetical protein EOP11_04040 [Pseudomonadota bacterium]